MGRWHDEGGRRLGPEPRRHRAEPGHGPRGSVRNLDLLVCVDMFENETAACDRKPTGVTYLIPACAHVEKAGSATNSGRTLQWRYQATNPAGNSKADLELLLRFAKALDAAGAFSHIQAVWDHFGITYRHLGLRASCTARRTAAASVGATATLSRHRRDGRTASTANHRTTHGRRHRLRVGRRDSSTARCSVRRQRDRRHHLDLHRGLQRRRDMDDGQQGRRSEPMGRCTNRAKSRDNTDDSGNASPITAGATRGSSTVACSTTTPRSLGDVADFFMGPDSCVASLREHGERRGRCSTTRAGTARSTRWPTSRTRCFGSRTPASPHFAGTPSRSPAASRPTPSPTRSPRRPAGDDVGYATPRARRAVGPRHVARCTRASAGRRRRHRRSFPLVLTTIRCVEHFQGGPITRNNSWNVELEPEPWIEINSVDARNVRHQGRRLGQDRDRPHGRFTNDASTPTATTPALRTARASGPASAPASQANQRVGPGVVAIPWHWGDRGLSTGSRANDLCIDAGDANTAIPEYKACLCRIEKM